MFVDGKDHLQQPLRDRVVGMERVRLSKYIVQTSADACMQNLFGLRKAINRIARVRLSKHLVHTSADVYMQERFRIEENYKQNCNLNSESGFQLQLGRPACNIPCA